MKLFSTLVVVLVFTVQVTTNNTSDDQNHKIKMNFKIEGNLKDADIRDIAAMDDQEHFMNALKNMLVPRVVGTQSWRNVQKFIINELKSMNMDVELDSFSDNTPFGKVNFVNIIGRMNPSADKFLVLSAHYDSKYFQSGKFIGATGKFIYVFNRFWMV